MPSKPTKSNLMRAAKTGTTAPICKSKDKPVAYLTVCDCKMRDQCATFEYIDISYQDFLDLVDDISEGFGDWIWLAFAEDVPLSGSFDYCIPSGQGNAIGHGTYCAAPHDPFDWATDNTTYAEVHQTVTDGYGASNSSGNWTSFETGLVYPVSWQDCP